MDVPDGTYTQISTNERHTCAITTDGEVECWGFNDLGQLDVPPGTYTDDVAGLNHTCALTTEAAQSAGTTEAEVPSPSGRQVESVTVAQVLSRNQETPHRHVLLRTMSRYVGMAAGLAVLALACQRAPDQVVTARPVEAESQAIATPVAQTSASAQPAQEVPLRSDINLPKTPRGSRLAVPDIVPKDPPPVSDGRREIAATYVPQGAARPTALQIVDTDGFSPRAVHTVPLTTRTQEPPWLLRSARVQSIVATAERWLMPVTVTTRIQFSQFLPGDFEHDAVRVYEVHPSVHGAERIGGLKFFGGYYESDTDFVSFDCFVSWARMEVTPAALDLADENWTRENVDLGRISHHILTARWGEQPIRADPPGDSGSCCDIEVISTGFVAITPGLPPWYPGVYDACYESVCVPVLHYSSDGLTWEPVDVPTRYAGFKAEEFPIWVCSVESVPNGVIVREAIDLDDWMIYQHYNNFYEDLDACGEGTYWSADGDLTNWRKLLTPPFGYG